MKNLFCLTHHYLLCLTLLVPLTAQAHQVSFWNGNKTPSRQLYEQQVLQAALSAAGVKTSIDIDERNLSISEEASVFSKQLFDVFATVQGNPKLNTENKILIAKPIMQGLLGQRLLIIRKTDSARFDAIKQTDEMKKMRSGIPTGWADVTLFKANQYNTVEIGNFETIFHYLVNNDFDYLALGANEIEQVYQQADLEKLDLTIAPTLMLRYNFPVVFYVNPNNPELAKHLNTGLELIIKNGSLKAMFDQHFGHLYSRLHLADRISFELKNPLIKSKIN
ncbi:transporter substrate-binding domain-containing protein [Colwellia sp. BRX10-3]|uniref:transporter substrate-binding domain-containing protein n=1 Tax=Colwellia sp. BRX10-3 TaxID=2759844 RepID=UPI0015F6BA2A|nr:transporter substrate-binding domain-containing protein [Colwellia sp. BRX10-3]MBA6390418.1 transporter substrate-binding domain-containing protein [Colwellia sp. BRX10-3]